LARNGKILAGQWYDARIAAVCLCHGVRELWTVDRDYSRFPDLNTVNPLADR
jgi:predicted nucleic acid-binding protein